jgi:hypothetical protein
MCTLEQRTPPISNLTWNEQYMRGVLPSSEFEKDKVECPARQTHSEPITVTKVERNQLFTRSGSSFALPSNQHLCHVIEPLIADLHKRSTTINDFEPCREPPSDSTPSLLKRQTTFRLLPSSLRRNNSSRSSKTTLEPSDVSLNLGPLKDRLGRRVSSFAYGLGGKGLQSSPLYFADLDKKKSSSKSIFSFDVQVGQKFRSALIKRHSQKGPKWSGNGFFLSGHNIYFN